VHSFSGIEVGRETLIGFRVQIMIYLGHEHIFVRFEQALTNLFIETHCNHLFEIGDVHFNSGALHSLDNEVAVASVPYEKKEALAVWL